MIALDWKGVALILAAAGVTVYLVRREVPELAAALDPTSSENVFYKGTNKIGGALTGDDDFRLGVWLWERFNTQDWGPLGPPGGSP